MTNYQNSFAAMLLGLPLCAAALELREQSAHSLAVVPMTSAPAEPAEERPHAAPRLRDSLRQTLSDSEAAAKPYRLTPEERQRLREQLRGQPEQAARSQ